MQLEVEEQVIMLLEELGDLVVLEDQEHLEVLELTRLDLILQAVAVEDGIMEIVLELVMVE
jgi:hypothetical protein